MRLLALQITAVLGLAGVLRANDTLPTSLTANETVEVRQKLEAYEKGNATYEQLTTNEAWGRKLVVYYLSDTNAVTVKMKLPISRALAGFQRFPEAAQLAQEYANVYSNDWRGWSIVGTAKLVVKSYDEAISAYTNAVRLGDEEHYPALGLAALAVKREDILRTIVVPRLLVLKDAERIPRDERNDMVKVLLGYSLQADRKEIFLKALQGLDIKEIRSNEEIKMLVGEGCDEFESKAVEKICQELEKAKQKNSEPEQK
jgi:tetratricopeptide (TPR) repeat protein